MVIVYSPSRDKSEVLGSVKSLDAGALCVKKMGKLVRVTVYG